MELVKEIKSSQRASTCSPHKPPPLEIDSECLLSVAIVNHLESVPYLQVCIDHLICIKFMLS